MKPSELRVLLAQSIRARLPILITGAPGIGKSDIVAQAAADAGADLILSHPAVEDPTDVKGLPWIVNGAATFLPFGELRRAESAEKLTVWFLDDLGQATAAVQASYMQLLLARRVNGHVLSDLVVFVGATNRRTDRGNVTAILEPVKSRFASIVELETDLNDWCRWAIDHSLPAEVVAFMRFRPDLLCAFAATNDLTNSPVPRTWAHAAKILALSLEPSILNVAVAGAVGAAAAAELLAFVRLYHSLPSIDALLLDPLNTAYPSEPASLYAVTGALAYCTTEQNFARVAQFVERLERDNHGEFAVLLLRDALQRKPEVQRTQAYVRLVVGPLGQLISGK